MRGIRTFILSFAVFLLAHPGRATDLRPWAEYETAGLLVMSSVGGFGSMEAKTTLMENLPAGVTALIYTQYFVDQAPAQMQFGRYVAEGKAVIVHFPIVGEGTWTRDVMPVPLVASSQPTKLAALVGAKHALYFEPDRLLAQTLRVPLREHTFEFEGGNFLASSDGDCLIVNGFGEQQMPDSHFEDYYRCRRVIRFPYVKDIGHIDERVKLLADGIAITDEIRYRSILEDAGYKVLMVPARAEPYENYLNSVLLNGVAFVPVFGDPTRDNAALEVYRSTGQFRKIIAVPSKNFVDDGTGGIHCLTATFPRSL